MAKQVTWKQMPYGGSRWRLDLVRVSGDAISNSGPKGVMPMVDAGWEQRKIRASIIS